MTENETIKDLNFFLVLCKTRKKLDKYMKLNRIRNKYIIDINKMLDETEMTYQEAVDSDLFKVMIIKRISMAIEKKKDIYYVPYLKENKSKPDSKVFNIKTKIDQTHNFNLLYFYTDFSEPQSEVLDRIGEFDLTQILKDY